MVSAGDRMPGSLEVRIVTFNVPPGWASAEGPNPPDAFQKFLEQKGLWLPEFLYGSAPVGVGQPEKLIELISKGFVPDQLLGNGLLKLVGVGDGMDNYCNGSFFRGDAVVAIYHKYPLNPAFPDLETEGLGLLLFNPPERRFALAAVVLPNVKLAAELRRPDS